MPRYLNPVHERLATNTMEAHQALHVHPVLSKLTSPKLSLQDYAFILNGYLSFYRALESKRFKLKLFEAFNLGQSIDALIDDLYELGIIEESLPAEVEDASWVQCEASCIAMLYVMFGSRFGSRHIVKQIEKSNPSAPTRYFSLPQCGDLWHDLINHLGVVGKSEKQYLLMEGSAEMTFNALGQHLMRPTLDLKQAAPLFA